MLARRVLCGKTLATNCFKTLRATTSNAHIVRQQIRCFSRGTTLLADRKYSEKHEWVELNGKNATIGISEFAQDQLGDIVYAQPPEAEADISQDEEVGALESVKAASELYAPLTGIVTEANKAVIDNPALINISPYEDGWLWKMEVSKPEEFEGLMDEKAYKKFLRDSV
ncbi:Glycine cleavage system H protein, mitochondrial [Lamellibrachia satsuma]|nr:Glycine cleavage system H protein, mitochondrial [Lamellibrachia satsuma]